MDMKRKQIRSYFVCTVFLSYIFVFLLPSFCFLYNFQKSTGAMERNMENAEQASLAGTEETISRLFRKIQSDSFQLALQVTRQNSAIMQMSANRNFVLSQTKNQMFYDSVTNPIVDTGYIFLFNSSEIITPFIAGTALDYFYGSFFTYQGQDIQGFQKIFTDRYYDREILPISPVFQHGSWEDAILVAQSIPADESRRPYGVIIFTMNTRKLDDLLQAALNGPNSIAALYAGDEKLAAVQGEAVEQPDRVLEHLRQSALQNGKTQETVDGIPMRVFTSGREDGAIWALAATPSHSVSRDIRDFRVMMLLQGIFVTLLSFGLAAYYTKKNLYFVDDIFTADLSLETSQSRKGGAYRYVRSYIKGIIEQNAALNGQIQKNSGLVMEAFGRKLLNDGFLRKSDLISEFDRMGVSVSNSKYLVILVCISSTIDDQEPYGRKPIQHKMELRQKLSSVFQNNCIICDEDAAALSVILFLGQDPGYEWVASRLDEIQTGIPFGVYGGNFVEDIMDTVRSYQEAKIVRGNHSCCPNRTVFWYHSLYRDKLLYHYQYNLYFEQKLLNHIKAGNELEVNTMLEEMGGGQAQEGTPEINVLRCMVYELYRVACLTIEMQDADFSAFWSPKIGELFDAAVISPASAEEFFHGISDMCKSATQKNKASRRSSSQALYERIKEYVAQHFDDSLLSVTAIAEHFRLSDKYISQFFKEQQNDSLSKYIETIRLNRADILLKNSDMTINDIAVSVGYANPHTFRAAFKKVKGITPSQYREG